MPTSILKTTVLLVENVTPVCWMAPIDLPVAALEDDATSIRHHHRAHPNIVMADGTAKFIPTDKLREMMQKIIGTSE